MPGVMIAQGPCYVCGHLFMFHPLHVPSVQVCARCKRPLDQHQGQDHEVTKPSREPICRTCMGWVNTRRAQIGQPQVTIHPRAYDAADEEEVPWEE